MMPVKIKANEKNVVFKKERSLIKKNNLNNSLYSLSLVDNVKII